MSSRRRLSIAGLLLLLSVTGCGSQAEPAPAEADVPPVALNAPLTEIPREELYGAPAAANLWSPRVELEVLDLPPGWDGARIAILSDFHLGIWEENAEVAATAVQRAIQEQPDVVVLLGDYVADAEQLPQLRQIIAPLGGVRTVAVLGDQDIQTDSLEAQVASTLRSAGVVLLRNESVALELNGDTAWIAGLDPSLLGESGGDVEYILATTGPQNRTPVLLTHVPGFAARAPSGRYPVVIAGNTFCGDVEVPATPRLSWVRDELFPGGVVEGTDDRLYRVRGQTVLVTCGLGYGFVPIRFGAPPEVPLLTLRRIGPPVDEAPDQGSVVADSLIERFQGAPQDTL